MAYLIRFRLGKPHHVAHHVHKIGGVVGALCSQMPTPAVGDRSQGGDWELMETIPPQVRICRVCEKIKHKLDNPLPARVENELAMLARWDQQAAALQREKMLAYYRKEQLKRKSHSR